jgi:hypothetical protein
MLPVSGPLIGYHNTPMPKYLRYTLWTLASLVALWILLIIGAFLYIRTHKASLTAKANTFLNQRFMGSIHIGDIGINPWSHFPYPSLELREVYVDDSIYSKAGVHTVYLKRVRVVPGFKGLFSGHPQIREVVLDNGSFLLYRDSSNYYNGYVWSPKEAPKPKPKSNKVGSGNSLPVEVLLSNVSLTIADSIRHKLYSFDVHTLYMVQNGTIPVKETPLKPQPDTSALGLSPIPPTPAPPSTIISQEKGKDSSAHTLLTHGPKLHGPQPDSTKKGKLKPQAAMADHATPVNPPDTTHQGGSNEAICWKTNMDITVNALAFKMDKGIWLKGQHIQGEGKLALDLDKLTLLAKDMGLNIGGQKVNVEGAFFFHAPASFRLHIQAPSLAFASGRSWLPYNISKKLDSLNFANPISVEAKIEGFFAGGNQPFVAVNWTVSHNTFSGYVGSIYDCSFHGYFNNHVHDSIPPGDPNSTIKTDTLSGKFNDAIPLVIPKIEIARLDTAILTFRLSLHNGASDWDDLIQSDALSLDKGRVNAELLCSYPLSSDQGIVPSIDGTIDIHDVELTYVPRQVKITNGQIELALGGQDIDIKKISGNIAGSPIIITGRASHVFTLADMDTAKMVLDWKLSSPAFDLGGLLPFLGKSSPTKAKVHKQDLRLLGMGKQLDRFLKLCKVRTQLNLDQLTYQRFKATKVNALLNTDKGMFTLSSLTLNCAKGNISASGSLNPDGDINQTRIKAKLSNVDLPSLFFAFNNFGQKSMGAQNLQGTLNAQTSFSMGLANSGKKIPNTLNGTMQFNIDSGALINFSPVVNMGKFAFKSRDLSHVHFARLYDTFRFSRDTVIFNKMEVQSTVLELIVQGVYKLDGSFTDAVVQVPLSNLKKKKELKDNQGVDTKRGPSVWVRASNKGDEPLHYSFSLFKKKVAGVKN